MGSQNVRTANAMSSRKQVNHRRPRDLRVEVPHLSADPNIILYLKNSRCSPSCSLSFFPLRPCLYISTQGYFATFGVHSNIPSVDLRSTFKGIFNFLLDVSRRNG